MKRLFEMDGPFISILTKIADLVILNTLFIICSLPIVTLGASYTALYYVTLKMVKNEECYTAKSFFKSFKQNFKQATVLWLIIFVVGAVLYYDFKIINGDFSEVLLLSETTGSVMTVLLMSISLIYTFTSVYVFPVLSRFDNSNRNTLKNSLIMSIRHFPSTIAVILVTFVPFVIMYFSPNTLILIFLIFALSAYINSFMFVKIFRKYMPEVKITNDDEFKVDVEE